MKTKTMEELDLAIPDMNSEADEINAGRALKGMPGIEAVRFVSRGAWISYSPEVISKEEICREIRNAGFRAATFQDSKSGHLGKSSA